MIILHNSKCRYCRDFVDTYGGGAFIFDWYEGGHELWLSLGFTNRVSQFVSVPVYVPSYLYDGPTGVETIPEIPQLPLSGVPNGMATIQAELDRINADLAASEALGLYVEPITLDNLDDDLAAGVRALYPDARIDDLPRGLRRGRAA